MRCIATGDVRQSFWALITTPVMQQRIKSTIRNLRGSTMDPNRPITLEQNWSVQGRVNATNFAQGCISGF